MYSKILFPILVTLALASAACHHDAFIPEEPVNPAGREAGQVQLRWTAFKFSNRTPVSGSFSDIRLTRAEDGGTTLPDLLRSTRFDIRTASLNTGMEFRDNNIINFFFRNLLDGEHIHGSISCSPAEAAQNACTIQLNLNGMERGVPAAFRVEGEKLVLEGSFDLADWSAQAALEGLNRQVLSYHTGPDGINKLWSQIQFRVEYDITN